MQRKSRQHFRASRLALSVTAALAMTTMVQAQQGAQVEEIAITGTRIRSTDGMVTPTPVTSVTTDEINNYEPGTSISEQLSNLPQFLNTQTAQRGGAIGLARESDCHTDGEQQRQVVEECATGGAHGLEERADHRLPAPLAVVLVLVGEHRLGGVGLRVCRGRAIPHGRCA